MVRSVGNVDITVAEVLAVAISVKGPDIDDE
jgi:hypothetical protein